MEASTDQDRLELDFVRDPSVLRLVADELGEGVLTIDAAGKVVAWSAAAERITGYRAAEVQGRSLSTLRGVDEGAFDWLLRELSAGQTTSEGPCPRECRLRGRDSRERRVVAAGQVLRDPKGVAYGAIAAFRDLSLLFRDEAVGTASPGLAGLVGTSAAMQEVFRQIRQVAPTEVTVLIRGESGTGKELTARALHDLSPRRDQPFLTVSCAALPEPLLESELFGHRKGAFTGAAKDRRGLLELAHGGTLFLDEIGELSPALQGKLLRALQEREIRRLGAEESIPLDVRVVSATHRDLEGLCREGGMREDFYYRIRVLELVLPPLRQRLEDLPQLARSFVVEFARRMHKDPPSLAPDALEALLRHSWPGNVRELRNAIEHGMVLQRGHGLSLLDLPAELRGGRDPVAESEGWTGEERAERLAILDALDQNGWNRTRTARSLGISRVTLWKRIRRYRLDEGIFRQGTRDEL